MAPQRRAAAKAEEQIRRLAAVATTASEDEDEDQESESGGEGEMATGTGTGNDSNSGDGNPPTQMDAAAAVALPPASGPAPSVSENSISRTRTRTRTRSRKQNRKQKRRASGASASSIDQSEDDSDGDDDDGLKFRSAPVADQHRNQVTVAVALPPAIVPPPTINPSEQSTTSEQEALPSISTSTPLPQLQSIMENLKIDAAEPEIDWRDDDPGFFAEALAEYEAAYPEYRGFEDNDDDGFHLPNIDQLSPRESHVANQMANPEAQEFGDDGFPLPDFDQLSPREDQMADQMAHPEAQESEEFVNFEDFLEFEDDNYYYPSIDQLMANRDVPPQSLDPIQPQAELQFGFGIIHRAPAPLGPEVTEEEDDTVDPSHLRNDRAYRLPICREPSEDALTLAAIRLAGLRDNPDQTDEESERSRLTRSLVLDLERVKEAKDKKVQDEALKTRQQSQLQPQPQLQPQSQPQPQLQLQQPQPQTNVAIALNMLSIVGLRKPDPQPFGSGRGRVRLQDKEDLALCDFCFFESPSGITNTRVWLPVEASAGFCNDCCYAPNTAAQELWQWQARKLPGRSSGGQRATYQDNSAQSIVPPLETLGEEQKFHQEALNEMRSERRTERIKAHRMALAMSRDPNGAQAPPQSGHGAIQAAKAPTKAAPMTSSAQNPNTPMGNLSLQRGPDMGPMRNLSLQRGPDMGPMRNLSLQRGPDMGPMGNLSLQRGPDMGPTVNFPSQYPPLSSTAGPAGNTTYDMTFTMPNRPQNPIPGIHEPHHKTLGDRMPPTTTNSDMGGRAPPARAVNLQQAPAAYAGSKGPNFCRGFPYRQVDFTKARICTYCVELKTFIMNHRHHTAFTPLIQVVGLATGHLMYQGLGRIENGVEVHDGRWKHCMVCTERAVYGCDSCPLRLCVACQVYLTHTSKGSLNDMVDRFGAERRHLRNDAFLLRSDGRGF
ncbi:hypothetical protein LZ554_008235 [Drepanopeziza brunnea f. sp. 'monogermtubi']|nr:hypothetical protein LZ554_008235 [Drepanopeziza brunnea f. sp. 'monogermtubi']